MPEITLRDPCDIAAAERALKDVTDCCGHLLAAVRCARLAAVDLDCLERFAADMEREVATTITDTCLDEIKADIEAALNTPLPVVSPRVSRGAQENPR